MTGSFLVAFDLDRTLIYSAGSAGPDAPADARVVEVYDGAPLSRMTQRSWSLLGDLMRLDVVVPVTTRSVAQYQRVGLPAVPRHAITTNGGTLLVDGLPDPEWRDESFALAARSAPLAEMNAVLAAVADEPWVKLVRDVEDLFCYLVAHSREAIPEAWVAELETLAEQGGWRVSVQGRKVYVVPEGLGKGSAVERLVRRLPDGASTVTLASGDSLLDASMLEVAHHALRPAHGELHDAGWAADHVRVTTTTGILAGEEILAWALGHVSPSSVDPGAPSTHAGSVANA
ncbi:HAD family hydrolase [Nocardioides aromaticivorans]|uniref:HAD family hydrolase n=1 Tax=Nocardioides aromaticivorans TaxID=200618 RepID=UPI001A8C6266|nr:HAD family hydrolase [Nocardioides aromaticivorans]